MDKKIAALDEIDLGILKILQADAWIPLSTVAERLGVANATVHLRLSKMREQGVVGGAHLHVDTRKLGFDIRAFVGIVLHQASDYEKVLGLLEKLPQVTEAHYATGAYNILAKIHVRDVDNLHLFLVKNLQRIKEIQSTETLIILDTPIERFLEWDEQNQRALKKQ